MKIGIEVQRLFRKKKYGIETSSLELIKKLQQADSKYEFVIFAKDDVDNSCFAASENFTVKTVAGRFFADFEQFFLPIACKREKIDLLHCTGNTTPYYSPIPVVQTLHDIIFMDPIPRNDTLYQQLGNHYRRKLVPMVSKRSRAIITVSNYEKERIVSRLGIDENKIEVIYNGINEKHFHIHTNAAELERIKQRYSLPNEFILYLGNPASRKNPLGVIEAYVMYCHKVGNPLPLVTPGLSSIYVSRVLKDLNAHYSATQFITPGYIRDEDLPFVYNLCKVFLFPSLSEGFGMPIAEAMACGTPVITSKISSMPEIAGDAALLVDPLSAPSIADALIRLQKHPELHQEKIKQGLINARRFSWTKTAEQVMAVYEKVLFPATKSVPSQVIFEPNFYFFNKPRF